MGGWGLGAAGPGIGIIILYHEMCQNYLWGMWWPNGLLDTK